PTTFPSSQRLNIVVGWEPPALAASQHYIRRRLLHLLEPGISFGLRLFGCKSVALLEAAFELRAFAFDNIKVVSGELAPLGLDLPAEFLPFSFNLIPIHTEYPL